MAKPIRVEPREDFKIFLEYSDGLSGEIKLSNLMARKEYAGLLDRDKFVEVSIDPSAKDIVWANGASVCKVAAHNILELRKLSESISINFDRL